MLILLLAADVSLLFIWLLNSSKTAEIAAVFALIVGLIWAAAARVSLFEAAIEADLRWDLQDLLSTALSSDFRGNETWNRAVLAVAEEQSGQLKSRLREIRPASAHNWSGAAFLGVFVVAVSALWPSAGRDSHPISLALLIPRDSTSSALQPESRDRPPGEGGVDESPARSGSATADAVDLSTTVSSSDAANNSTSAHSQSSSDRAGGGLARTSIQSNSASPVLNAQRSAPHPTGTPASGGIAAISSSSSQSSAGLISGTSPILTPPWQSSQWAASRAAATAAIQSGRIDPTYQDLVRDYFQR